MNETITELQPQIDEQQTLEQAQNINEQLSTAEVPQLPQGEETASIATDIVKGISKGASKLFGETATDTIVKDVASKASKEAPKADLSAWANRKFLATKPVEKTKTIKDLVTTKTPEVPTAEQQANKLFDSIENGKAPKFNDIDPMKEATGLAKSDIDDFNQGDSYQLKFDTIDSDEDIQKVLGYVAEKNKTNIEFARRGVVTDDQIRKLADDLGQDPKTIQDFLTRQAGGALPTAEYVVAMRQVLDKSAVKLKELADLVTTVPLPENKINFAKQFDLHRKMQTSFMGVRAEYGRGLRAMGIPLNASESDMNAFLGAMEHNLDITQTAKMISNAETSRGINKLVDAQSSVWKYGADFLYTNYVSSMLSGLSTQMLNFGGNIVNMSLKNAERMASSWIPSSHNWSNNAVDGEITAMMIGYQSAFTDATKAFWKTFSTGDLYKGLSGTGEMMQLEKPSEALKLQGLGGTLLNGLFHIINFPIKNMMGGTDAFFRVLNERATLSAEAYKEARLRVDMGELDPAQFSNYLKGLLENPSDELKFKAENFAKEVGYQEQVGSEVQKLTSFVKSVPSLRYFVPFINTLSNVTKQSLVEHTPLAILQQKFRDDMSAGGARQQLATTKLIFGMGTIYQAFSLADNGSITGAMPNDPATQALWKEAGIKPYSFVFHNDDGTKSYVSYQSLEPFATLFGISASLSEYHQKLNYVDMGKSDEQKYNSLMSNLLHAVSENTLQKSFAVGIKTVFDAFSDGQKAFEKLTNSFANTLIPYAGARRNITKEFDEVKRSTKGNLEYIQSQIPALSDNLPPILDNFGEEVKHDYTWIRWAPVTDTNDNVRKELVRLNEATKRMAINDVSDIISGYLSDPKEIYKWKKFARKDMTDTQGRNFHALISDIISSDGYQKSLDIEKVHILGTITRQWDMSALEKLSKDDPIFYEAIIKKDIVKRAMILNEQEGLTKEDALKQARDELSKGE